MPGSRKITRRAAVGGIGIGALGVVAAPSILKAQTKEIVVGGGASHKPWVESTVQPFFEQSTIARSSTRARARFRRHGAQRHDCLAAEGETPCYGFVDSVIARATSC
jgi:hypothetical protein